MDESLRSWLVSNDFAAYVDTFMQAGYYSVEDISLVDEFNAKCIAEDEICMCSDDVLRFLEIYKSCSATKCCTTPEPMEEEPIAPWRPLPKLGLPIPPARDVMEFVGNDCFKFLLVNTAWHALCSRYMQSSKAISDEALRKKLRYASEVAKDIVLVQALLREASRIPTMARDPAIESARFFQSEHFLKESALAEVNIALQSGRNDAAANLAWEEAEKCGLGEHSSVQKLRDMLAVTPSLKNTSWSNKASFHYD